VPEVQFFGDRDEHETSEPRSYTGMPANASTEALANRLLQWIRTRSARYRRCLAVTTTAASYDSISVIDTGH
jgi:hypothetical protein